MSVKLAILGLLLERDMHPYEIGRVMRERSYDRMMKLQYGSLYYAIEKLVQDGQIVAMETVTASDRPDKTIYRITDAGRTLFEQLIAKEIRSTGPVYYPLYMALALSRHIDQSKLQELVEERVGYLEQQTEAAYLLYEEHIETVPRSVLHLMYGRYEHCRTELRWLKRISKDVSERRLNDVGAPLDLERDTDSGR